MMINCWVVFSHGKRDLEQGLWCNKNVGKHRHFSKEDIRKASIESCLQDTLPGPSEMVKALWGLSFSHPTPERKAPSPPSCTALPALSPSLNVQKCRPGPTPILHGAGNARTPHILYASQEKRDLRELGGVPFTTRFITLTNRRGNSLEIRDLQTA